jgi:hypothetical protein
MTSCIALRACRIWCSKRRCWLESFRREVDVDGRDASRRPSPEGGLATYSRRPLMERLQTSFRKQIRRVWPQEFPDMRRNPVH